MSSTNYPVQWHWKRDLGLLFGLALVTTLPFWFTDLDMAAQRLFYRPEDPAGPWPVAQEPLFNFLFHVVPFLTVVLALGAVAILLGARLWAVLHRWRLSAVFILLGLVVGPGLVVNAIFKDHWGRDRPRHVETLGGQNAYQPPLVLNEAGQGKSFPCGHCSVAFLLAGFWLLWRRRYPRVALIALAASVTLGALVGMARMAAGGHFLSDVLWSAWLTWLVLLVLYYFVLRIPDRETMAADPPKLRRPRLVAAGYGLLGVLIVFGSSLATPHATQFRDVVPLGDLDRPAHNLVVMARNATVKVLLLNEGAQEQVEIVADFRGFGLPGNRILGAYAIEAGDAGPTIVYRLREQGLFTEVEGTLILRVPAQMAQNVSVRLGQGDIHVTGDGTDIERNALDLHTERGRVVW